MCRVCSVSDGLLAGAPLSPPSYSHHHGFPGETACPGQRWTRTHAPPKLPDFNEMRALISTYSVLSSFQHLFQSPSLLFCCWLIRRHVGRAELWLFFLANLCCVLVFFCTLNYFHYVCVCFPPSGELSSQVLSFAANTIYMAISCSSLQQQSEPSGGSAPGRNCTV